MTVTCHSLRASGPVAEITGDRPVGPSRCDSTRLGGYLSTGHSAANRCRTLRDVARVVVDVMLKPEIHDPQGEAIASACHRLGFGQVDSASGRASASRWSSTGPGGRGRRWRQVAELAAELLANPVIEDFTVQSG